MSSEAEDQVPIIPPEFLDFLDGILSEMETIEMGTSNRKTTRLRRPKTTWRQGRKMAGNVPYTTELDRRRRFEVQALRWEVEQLNAQLSQLMRPQLDCAVENQSPELQRMQRNTRKWLSVALAERKKLVGAEKYNQELKLILSKQLRTISAFRKLLRHSNTSEGRDFVERLHPATDEKFLRLDFSKPLLDELSGNLARLRLQVDDKLPVLDETLAVSLRVGSRQHETYGICFEKNEVTQMPCTTQQAADILWRYLTNSERIEQTCRSIQSQSTDPFERGHIGSQVIRTKSGELMPVNVLTSFRKYKEEGRVILVGTLVWLLHGEGGLQLEDKHWTVVSPRPTDPKCSVIQSFARMQVRNRSTNSIPPKHEEVINDFSQKSHLYLQQRQDEFSDQAYSMMNYE